MSEKLLLWQRNEISHLENFLLELNQRKNSTGLIEMAYKCAQKAHRGQYRKSGDSFLTHPLSVVQILGSFELDEVTIAAALLHDVIEDTGITLEEIKAEFGEEVAQIVDGLTKLDQINFESQKEAQAAYMRKMMVAVAKDIRVLFIKLADRLHNMRTLGALSDAQRERISVETLRVYAPLANRLGLQDLARQLEDLAFASLHFRWYSEIDNMVEIRSPERELYLTQVASQVEERLLNEGIKAQIIMRPKHLWSIHKKISSGKDFDDIYDLTGLRVILENVSDCYAAMGHIHSMWQFLPGRFKDHIAIPKFNLYQSLHTTVMGPAGKLIEIQIRTQEMDDRAERGIAAHWAYKEAGGSDFSWVNQMMDWVEDTSSPAESINNLHSDLEEYDEVFAFTPRGELISLPVGATPLDFAYAIHTQMGHSARGARVNGNLEPLSFHLSSGDVVEIISSPEKNSAPLLEWLSFAVSRKARNRIRQWFFKAEDGKDGEKTKQEAKTLINGSEINDSEAKDSEAVKDSEEHLESESPNLLAQNCRILVDGQDDIWVRLANCCNPTRKDEILGFVTRGRGVSVHTSDCENAASMSAKEPSRFIQVEWDTEFSPGNYIAVGARALDRTGLLKDIVLALPPQVFITSMDTNSDADGVAHLRLGLNLGDVAQVETILKAIRQVEAVYAAYEING